MCAKLFRRTVFENHTFYSVDSMKYFEDYLLFYQIVDVCIRFSTIQDVVYKYYQNPGSSTQLGVDRKRLEDSYVAYSYVYNKYKNCDIHKCSMISYMQKSIKTQCVLGYNMNGIVDELVCKYGMKDVLKPLNILKCNNFHDAVKIYFGTSKLVVMIYNIIKKIV